MREIKMKKKAEFNIQTFIITVLIFMGVVVTFGTMAYTMSDKYDTLGGADISSDFANTYNRIDDITEDTENIRAKVLDTQTGTMEAGSEFLGDALNSIKLVGQSVTTSTAMIQDIAVALGVDSMWVQIATTILIVMVITTIIFMVFRSRG